MINQTMKIALLGVSHWHVPLYLPGLPENWVVGVSDGDAGIAARIAAPYGCPAYTDHRQMLHEVKPDFVFAFAPHYRMHAVASELIEAGIPFTMEKPVGLDRREVETLYNAAERKNAFCAIPFVWRYSDTVNDLKNRYLSGKIVHMSYKFVAGPPSRYLATSRWMLSQETAGGGCMTNLGVHFIDMALYLTGSQGAEMLSSVYQYTSEYAIETYASSMLRLDTGASLLIESGYAYPMSDGAKRENRWTIVTENGYYILADNDLELRTFGAVPAHIALNTDSDPYYAIFARTTLADYANSARPRASLKEMLAARTILDEMNAKAAYSGAKETLGGRF
ncbi:Gfo/Idh/MocA family protein [Agathobaculum faecis]|uniref:Gfo/Idh/MocA family protein n=1 Tax=Agathobaculum TaxID=2048137 RepID=UPI001A9A904B|nr:Gfo/Idh/MocA family oxidoreductase [Agathobaculum faecis]